MGSYFNESSADAPVAAQRRKDIITEKVLYQGEPFWVCKDSLGQEYQHLNEQEYAIFSWLDGVNSFNDLKEKFEREFPPFQVELRELAQVVGELYEKSLLVTKSYEHGPQISEMGREKFRKELQQKLLSIYAIKWKGFDPEAILNFLNPWVTWYFSKRMVMVVMMMTIAALVFAAMNYSALMQRMPSIWDFLDPANWLTLGVLIALTKLLHEFGHAFAFKRFGGEVHEIGVMIFFFAPTMYCNTTDSWLLPNKWQRAAVGLGGIYIELTILTLATFAWWASPPGAVQDIALNLIFICSIGTVLLNGNPLLKYDGYFVLADLMEIPNMAQKGNEQIRRKFMVHAMGIEDEECLLESTWNKRFLIVYGIAAYLFRLSLMLTVAFFLVDKFANYGLAPLAAVFSGITTVIYLLTPIYKLVKQLTKPGTMIKTKSRNISITTGIILLLIGVCFVPYSFYVQAECNLDGGDAVAVVAVQEGMVADIFAMPGDRVTKGQKILQLKNLKLEQQLAERISDFKKKKSEIQMQRYNATKEFGSVSVESLQREAAEIQRQVTLLKSQQADLTITAATGGIVVGVSHRNKEDSLAQNREISTKPINYLRDRQGITFVKAGTEICRVLPDDGSEQSCSLSVKQTDHDLVTKGQLVYILFEGGHIVHESEIALLATQSENQAEAIDFEADSQSAQMYQETQSSSESGGDGMVLESTLLKAKCYVQNPDAVFGATGIAKIYVGPRSVAWRIARRLRLFLNTKL